jgi:hypothetical protein
VVFSVSALASLVENAVATASVKAFPPGVALRA